MSITFRNRLAERRWPGLGGRREDLEVHLRARVAVAAALGDCRCDEHLLARPGELSEEGIALGQGLADIATIGLLQERAVKEQNILAEQLQGALNNRVLVEQAKGMFAERHGAWWPRPLSPCAHPRSTRQPLVAVVNQVIDGTFETSTVRRTR